MSILSLRRRVSPTSSFKWRRRSFRRPRNPSNVSRRPLQFESLEDRQLLAFVVNSTDDLSDQTPLGDGVVDVDLVTPGHQITLRGAIEEANATPETDTINFNIPGTAPHTIGLASHLPPVQQPVNIDGTTQPGFKDTPIVVLDGTGFDERVLAIGAGNSTVRALAIRTAGTAIKVSGKGNNLFSNLDLACTEAEQSGTGMELLQCGKSNTIDEVIATNREVGIDINQAEDTRIFDSDLSGCITAIDGFRASGTEVVDVNASCTETTPTGYAVKMAQSSNCTILNSEGRFRHMGVNFGTNSNNIWIEKCDFSDAGSNAIQIGKGQGGKYIDNILRRAGAHALVIRGDSSSEVLRNNVTDSANGIVFWGIDGGSFVGGGNIGLDTVPGTAVELCQVTKFRLAGQDVSYAGQEQSGTGIDVTVGSSDITIEDVTGMNRNVGVSLLHGSGDSIVDSNFQDCLEGIEADYCSRLLVSRVDVSWTRENTVGTGIVMRSVSDSVFEHVEGTGRETGIHFYSGDNDRNILRYCTFSGAGEFGIYHHRGRNNSFESNTVRNCGSFALLVSGNSDYQIRGTDVGGSANGFYLSGGSGGVVDGTNTGLNTVPGTAVRLRNTINTCVSGIDASYGGPGRSGTGIELPQWGWGNTIENVIVKNRIFGVDVVHGENNLIVGNTVVGNGTGVRVLTGTGNQIEQNSIHSNDGLGIDLGNNGVTLNDPGDGDTGPNNRQNFPVITAAEGGAATRVEGSLNSQANMNFVLEFFANTNLDASGYGEGERWLGSTIVTTGSYGNAIFDVELAAATAAGEFITATATDPDGNTSEFSAGFEAEITNLPPTADPNGPYHVNEGSRVRLDGSDSFDPEENIVDYEWDFNYDGTTFDVDATGVAPMLEGWNPDGPATRTVALRVRDSHDAESEIATTTVTVHNVAPTIVSSSLVNTARSCGGVAEGSPVEVAVNFTDPGFDDPANETWEDFTLSTIDWGDGNVETWPSIEVDETPGSEGVPTAGTVAGTHVYEAGGIYTVTITVRDDDGGVDAITTQAIISGVGITDDGVLQIVGTMYDDHVTVNRQGNGFIKVHADFLPDSNFRTFAADEIALISVKLCCGNDHATISGHVDKRAIIDGGPGDDHLNAGNAASVVLGGPGDDHINGGSGNDILIGGDGLDRLVGGPGEDVLIGDRTAYAPDPDTGQFINDAALLEILDEWNSGDDFGDRQDALAVWLNESTVFDDDDEDVLTGSSAEDWFYLFDDDIVTDGNSQSEKGGKKK